MPVRLIHCLLSLLLIAALDKESEGGHADGYIRICMWYVWELLIREGILCKVFISFFFLSPLCVRACVRARTRPLRSKIACKTESCRRLSITTFMYIYNTLSLSPHRASLSAAPPSGAVYLICMNIHSHFSSTLRGQALDQLQLGFLFSFLFFSFLFSLLLGQAIIDTLCIDARTGMPSILKNVNATKLDR